MTYVLLNGALVVSSDAAIPIGDRSFRYGDGLFETIPVHEGVPYLWERHVARLKGGLQALLIRDTLGNLQTQAMALLKANAVSEGLLRIHVSRGTGGRGYLPTPMHSDPLVLVETMMRPAPQEEPVTLWLSAYERTSPRSLPTQYKLAQGLNSTLARKDALAHECYDALQLGSGGIIAEAASANIFWRKGGTLYTPSLDSGALAGITRQRIMELSPYTVCEGMYDLAHLQDADAVILTNAASGIMAASKLLPQGFHWESKMLSKEFSLLRDNDIKSPIKQARE
jgi:branched-subunit amino acid aminotransferase/4-amino-4-deoxychorismate lyase